MKDIIEREMTISHSEFFRLLPRALKSYPYQQREDVIIVSVATDDVAEGNQQHHGKGEIHITLSKERLRKIASLSLPVTDLTFQLNNVAENTKGEFFRQFDRSYHKGGG